MAPTGQTAAVKPQESVVGSGVANRVAPTPNFTSTTSSANTGDDPMMIQARQEYSQVKDKLRKHVEGLTKELYEQLVKKMFASIECSSDGVRLTPNGTITTISSSTTTGSSTNLSSGGGKTSAAAAAAAVDMSTIRDVQTNLRCEMDQLVEQLFVPFMEEINREQQPAEPVELRDAKEKLRQCMDDIVRDLFGPFLSELNDLFKFGPNPEARIEVTLTRKPAGVTKATMTTQLKNKNKLNNNNNSSPSSNKSANTKSQKTQTTVNGGHQPKVDPQIEVKRSDSEPKSPITNGTQNDVVLVNSSTTINSSSSGLQGNHQHRSLEENGGGIVDDEVHLSGDQLKLQQRLRSAYWYPDPTLAPFTKAFMCAERRTIFMMNVANEDEYLEDFDNQEVQSQPEVQAQKQSEKNSPIANELEGGNPAPPPPTESSSPSQETSENDDVKTEASKEGPETKNFPGVVACTEEGCEEAQLRNENQLNRHLISEHGIYPHACHVCNDTFDDNLYGTELYRHQWTLHRAFTGTYTCPQAACGRDFRKNQLLREHLHTHHMKSTVSTTVGEIDNYADLPEH